MNYMGSKQRIAKYIVPLLQKQIDDNNIKYYIEPFVGGVNVIDKIVCKYKIGSDVNRYLIALHRYAQTGKKFPNSITKEFYNKVRDSYNKQDHKYSDTVYGAVGFLSSMNGRFFDGGFANSSHGRDYYKEKRDNLIKQSQSPLYKDIMFCISDYSFCKDFSNCLIYCDPPYEGTKQYGINKNFDNANFWSFVRHLSWNNIVIVSEETAPEDFTCIWEQKTLRSIKAADKSYSTEKLFIYRG